MKHCPVCCRDYPDTDETCLTCHSILIPGSSAIPSWLAPIEPVPKNGVTRFDKIVAGIALVCIAISAILFLLQTKFGTSPLNLGAVIFASISALFSLVPFVPWAIYQITPMGMTKYSFQPSHGDMERDEGFHTLRRAQTVCTMIAAIVCLLANF